MTDQGMEAARPKSMGLLITGIALLGIGVVGAFIVKDAAERKARVEELVATFSNELISVSPDYTAMWVFVVIAALGAVALIVRAATNQAAPVKSEDSTGAA